MNYLAHIYLSGGDRRVQIGNFIGDAVKGNTYNNYPYGFRQGIILHRKIDDFSDKHPAMREAVAMGRDVLGRYSPVVMDIFFDHILAVDFKKYTGKSLKSFSAGFYLSAIRYYKHLPARIQGFIWHFIMTDRLGIYKKTDGIRQSLEIMATYRNLQVSPEAAVHFLEQHFNDLQALFRQFFPELQQMCKEELRELFSDKIPLTL